MFLIAMCLADWLTSLILQSINPAIDQQISAGCLFGFWLVGSLDWFDWADRLFDLLTDWLINCLPNCHITQLNFYLKGTMSPGFCSFFVITVLIIQLVTLFHAQNVAFTAKGRYQVEFSNRHQTITSFKWFFPRHNDTIWKSWPNFFKLQSISILVILSLKYLLIVLDTLI